MTPTPEQIEKMAEEYSKITTEYTSEQLKKMAEVWTEWKKLRGFELDDGKLWPHFSPSDMRSICNFSYFEGAHAMQSLMDAKAQCLVEALNQIDEQAFNNGYHGITAITLAALTKWRSP